MSSCPKNHDFCAGADRCLYPDGETQLEKTQRLEETITKLQAELAAWKKPFGPQTPEEIDIFIEEACRVEREIQEHAMGNLKEAHYLESCQFQADKMYAEAELEDCLKAMQGWVKVAEKRMGYAAVWKQLAKELRTKLLERIEVSRRWEEQAASDHGRATRWKRAAKRFWQNWGYASNLANQHGEVSQKRKAVRDELKIKVQELEQKLLKLQPIIKAFDGLKETLRRYEGCPAEDYPNAWWRARAIIREVKSD